MKKIGLGIMASLLVFIACEKRKEYTPEQANAVRQLSGNYHAYIDHKMIFAVVSFTAHYSKPVAITNEDGKVLFNAHGQCYFSDYQYPIPEEGYITCYFAYSEKADAMSFYYKGGANNKLFLRSYNLNIQSEDIFTLTDGNRVLTFEKVK